MKLTKLLLVFFLAHLGLYAQNPEKQRFTIKGQVVDTQGGIPLEYATLTATDVNNPQNVTGGITDPSGNFSVEVNPGTYTLTVDYISFETFTVKNKSITSNLDLGKISLKFAANSLDEVTVIAETTTVDVRLDKKIYNIGKDLTTSGATVSDALNNVPSVTVDVEGAISLRGNSNVRILINGKPSAIAGFGGTDALRQLPADAIERVEVITSPSARYDAEGTAGILNIILRKEKTLGLNGSIQSTIGFPTSGNVSTNLNWRTDKFNIFNNTGIRYRDAPGNAKFDNTYFDRLVTDPQTGLQTATPPRYDRIIEDREYDRLDQGFNTNLGMEYYLTEKSSLTATGFLRLGDDEDLTTNDSRSFNKGSIQERVERKEFEREKDESYQVALNYINNFNDRGHKLTADFQYDIDKENKNSLITEQRSLPTNQRQPFERIREIEDQKEYLFQADYVLPLGENAQFEAGYRGNFEKTATDYTLNQEIGLSGIFIRDVDLSNVFEYEQNVNALYTQYGDKFGKFNVLLGLRMEQTRLIGQVEGSEQREPGGQFNINFDKDYLGLFPTLNVIYELTDKESLSLGYNRRINRPRGFFINPFPSRSSEANVFQGNPDLDPAYSNAFDLGYLRKWDKLTLTTSVYYQEETDAFERIQEDTGAVTDNGTAIIRTLPINLSTNERYGAEAAVLYNPAKWLRLNASFNFFGFANSGDFNGINYDARNTSWFSRFSSKVSLPAKIDWQTNANYRGATENAQTRTEGRMGVDMAFSKDLMNDKATISFNVNDLFNSQIRRSLTTTNTFISDNSFQWRERSFNLSFTYRFNQKKERKEQRGGDIGGDDFEG